MEKMKKKRAAITFLEILTMLVSTFSFAFIIGGMAVGVSPFASADSYVPQGCCLEGKDGSICQNMNEADASLCESGLVSTDCSLIESCQTGCCYSPEEGICSLNSPKEKCEKSSGVWSNNPTCNIQQCQLGCCIIGDQAKITTSRECTNVARNLDVENNFQPLDADGSCNSKTNLGKKGACVTDTGDFSGEKNCKFTTKESCGSGEFYENYLCTSKELKTLCKPAKQTTCLEDKDQIYYLDTCGNIANIYDAKKFSEQSYWEKVIPAESSCSTANADCGNCDYLTGSRCEAYRSGKDAKPTYGDNVCRDLNCKNGNKHGESWCISDYGNVETPAVAPIGSRWFVGSCLDGEISITPCADFNQEICISNAGTNENGASFSEAKCIINNWRSCSAANEKATYAEVKQECDQYPDDCIMFGDIPGNEVYNSLPGFDKSVANSEQGAAGDVGKGSNVIIPWCVAKNTPGMVFWSNPETAKPATGSSAGKTGDSKSSNSASSEGMGQTGMDVGGSLEETKAICSIGTFTCASRQICEPANNCDWKDKENWECNINADNSKAKETVPLTMEALNERCRSLGPCGIYVNVAGELGGNYSIKRTKIDEKGKTKDNQDTTGYAPSEDYLGSLNGKAGVIPAGSLTSLTAAVIMMITGKVTGDEAQQASAEVKGNAAKSEQTGQQTAAVIGSLGSLGTLVGSGSSVTAGTLASGTVLSSGSTVTFAADTSILSSTGVASTVPAGTTMTVAPGATVTLTSAAPVTGVNIASGSTLAGGSTPGLSAAGIGTAGLYAVGAAALGAVLGYTIGTMIAKNSGMTPGETSAFVGAMAGTGAAAGAAAYAYFGTAAYAGPVGWTLAAIAAVYAVYSYYFTGKDTKYYIIEYACDAWTPPKIGDCNSCNEDIRTCSEYRCKSLGLNCQYSNENGEPGWCATRDEIWSAKITPWPEALSGGNKYIDVAETHFSIEGNSTKEVAAWEPLEFGIITDKPATCKIDSKHTSSYEEMSTTMVVDNENCETSGCSNGNQGLKHKIALSPSVGANDSADATLSLAPESENNYYIRCSNFAGQANEAEFAVKIVVGKGEDYTPPMITKFVPKSNSYLKQGTNSTRIKFYTNEPADCKYSQGMNSRFEEMTGTAICLNDANSVYLNQWPCYAVLGNLTIGENKFYFQCQDQPEIQDRSSNKRNINRNSNEYILKPCETGLTITKLSPQNAIVVGKSPVSVTLEAETSGCVEKGKSTCYYSFPNGAKIEFFKTNSNKHSQTFSNLPTGEQNINVYCEDEAGNSANSNLTITINLDNQAPILQRAYVINQKLTILTDENAFCKYTNNKTIGCSFDFFKDNSTSMSDNARTHTAVWKENTNYFVKCADKFSNANLDCIFNAKTY